MKSSLYSRLMAVMLAALMATSAFAAGDVNRGSFKTVDSFQVGGKQLAAGEYVAQWKGAGPDVEVEITRHGKVLATVAARVVPLDQKAKEDSIETSKDSSGNKNLTVLQFSGKKYTLEIGSAVAQAGPKTASGK